MKTIVNTSVKTLENGIRSVLINDPKSYNSLSSVTLKSLLVVFKTLNKDNKTKVIILEGAGKGFSAGHNLKELKKFKKKNEYKKLFNLCSELMLEIVEGRKPVIAKVHGSAFAAGCQLAASCDLALSTNDAMFATPGVNIGLFCSTPMVALSRVVKNKHAMEMLLTGDFIQADKAKSIGLINNFFKEENLTKETILMANKIANKSSLTLSIGKKAFYNQSEMKISDAYKYASEVMIKNMMESDSEEGIKAFIEKRKPNWN